MDTILDTFNSTVEYIDDKKVTTIPVKSEKRKRNIPVNIIIYEPEGADEIAAESIFEAIKLMLNPR